MSNFSFSHLRKLWRVITVLALGITALLPPGTQVAWGATNDLAGPANSGAFGSGVIVLPNGNLVVTDPKYSPASGVNIGAVYLYDGTSHALISVLTGSQAGDAVGKGGITILNDGSFVVRSTEWANGASSKAGAVTWCSASLGCSGEVSSANSLVGSHAEDKIGYYGIGKLDDNAFLVKSPTWNNGAGALTFCSDGSSCKGIVSHTNSLTGSTKDDFVGGLVYVLPGDGYVAYAANWDNGSTVNVGAVTGCPMTGCTGSVSTTNSLHGSTASDTVGVSVYPLKGGGFVVSNIYWNKPGVGAETGAATYCAFVTACNGQAVSAANSLTGSFYNSFVGGNILVLPNGDYVVGSSSWKSGSTERPGAATYCHVSAGTSECTNKVISAANSLIGTHNGDFVGGGLAALTNSNYIASSSSWDSYRGAVTFCTVSSGASSCTNQTVSETNSLVGSNSSVSGMDGDQVGRDGLKALAGGGYVVGSSYWDNGSNDKAGAVTYCPPTGCTGSITTTNSLTGSAANDQVGNVWVWPLSNNNYVVMSMNWANAGVAQAGAATFCSVSGDAVTSSCNGQSVSTANSLVGSTAGDQIGSSYNLVALSNGGYLIGSPDWDNGDLVNAGAITFCPASGCAGPITSDNSQLGTQAGEMAGYDYYQEVADDYFVSPNSGYQDYKGVVSLCSIETGCPTPLSNDNSVFGGVEISDWELYMTFDYDEIHHQLIVGRPAENLVTFFTFGSAKEDSTTTLSSSSTGSTSVWGEAVTLTALVSPDEATGTVSFKGGSTILCADVALDATSQATCDISNLGADSYDLIAEYSGDESYNGSTSNTVTQVVNKADLTVSADNQSKDYGDADPDFTFEYSDFVNSDTASVVDTPPTCTVGDPHVNVENYPIVCSGGIDNNYAFTYIDGTLGIDPKAASVTPDTASKTYGEADPVLSGTLSGFLVSDGVSATYSRTSGEDIAGSPYTISAELTPSNVLSNYEITYNTTAFTITPRPITVTAEPQNKEYGEADPELTYQVTEGSLAFSDAFTGGLSREANENVDTYPITQGTLSTGPNYALIYVGAELVITPKLASVTPEAASKVYGSADPTLTGSLTGFLDGDGVTATYSRTPGETVADGPYTISATLSPVEVLGNYTLTYNTAAFTIEQKAVSVTPDPTSKIYGEEDPVFTGTLNGFLPEDEVTATYSRTFGETVAGSPYSISASLNPTSVLANYAITNNLADFSISSRPITVTADAQAKITGEADPELTYQITSGSLAFMDSFTGELVREEGEIVGDYAIQQGTLVLNDNYELTYIGADLAIRQAMTQTGLGVSELSPLYHGAVLFTAQVALVSPATGTATGTVDFMEGSTVLAADVPLVDGQAQFSTADLPAGAHAITAVYSGDETCAPSTSDPVSLTVQSAGVAVAISPDLSPSSWVNEAYTVTVLVSSPQGTPTGTVTVTDGTDECTFDLAMGISCELISTTPGKKIITATYSGDGDFEGGHARIEHSVWYRVILVQIYN